MIYLAPVFDNDDFDEFVQQVLDGYAARLSGWVASDGDPATAILQETARLAFELRQLVSDVGAGVFRAFGTSLQGVPSATAAAAQLTAQVSFADTLGHVIPAGVHASWQDSLSSQVYEFVTVSQTVAAAGAATVSVLMQAVDPGADFDVVPVGATLHLSDILAGVVSITTTTAASGGVDPEADDVYLDRLTQALTTLRVSVFNAQDAAILARSVPGIAKAVAVDGWNPDDATLGNDLTVGIVFFDAAGFEVSAQVAAAGIAYLTSDDVRGVNVVLRSGHVTLNSVNVVFAGVAGPGLDPAVVQTAAVAAITGYLSPARFTGTLVRYLDLATVLGRVDGLATITSLTLNGGTGDVTLSGVVAQPTATVSGTVNAP